VARVNDAEVRACCGIPIEGDTAAAILTANILVTESIANVDASVSADRLKAIETYLSAHFFIMSIREGALAANTLDDATERYHNIYGKGLNATWFGQQAVAMDSTGALAAMVDKAENPQRKPALFTVIGSQGVPE
jgi:hypothetical protein